MPAGLPLPSAADTAYATMADEWSNSLNSGWIKDEAINTGTGALSTNATFATATTFTVVGDQTTTYLPGRRLQIVHAGGTTYCEVSTAVFGAPNTTVTITNITSGPATMTSPITSVAYAVIAGLASGAVAAGTLPVNLSSTGYIAIGNGSTGYAQTGPLRIPNASNIYTRNSTGTGDLRLIGYDNTNILALGEGTDAGMTVRSPSVTVGVAQAWPHLTASAKLGADIAASTAALNGFVDVVSITPVGAAHWISAQLDFVQAPAASAVITARISDGVTTLASAEVSQTVAGAVASLCLGAISSSSSTWKLQYAATTTGAYVIKAAAQNNPSGNNATQINALKIGP